MNENEISTSAVVCFTCWQVHGSEGLRSPPKDSWWFIGAQLGAGLNNSQDHENDTMAKDVAPCLMWHDWCLWPIYTRDPPNPRLHNGLH